MPALIAAGALVSLLLGGCAAAAPEPPVSPSASAPAAPLPSPTPTPTPTPSFDMTRFSVDAADSIWVVVNKLRPLGPADYEASDLVTVNVPYVSNPLMRAEAATALEQMFAAGVAEGSGGLQVQNAYRSFATQTSVHTRLVAQLGQTAARAQSAQPGYSEHQTGLSLDIVGSPASCSIEACFGQTTQGVWLAANAWRYGYVLRYPADKTPITGYIYEPWHFRYVGVELATEMHETGVTTLEEFFGLPAAPDYAG